MLARSFVRIFCIAAGLAEAGIAPVLAHDLWIVPGRFVVEPGERVRVFVNSGDTFPEGSSLVSRTRIEDLRIHTSTSSEPVTGLGVDGKSLTFEVAQPGPGTVVLALSIEPRVVRLGAEDFNAYLEEEGLETARRQRIEAGETNRAAVERYSKSAKALLRVGEGGNLRWSEPVGLELEIVPLRSPYRLTAKEPLPVVVLFGGEPLAGVTIFGSRAGGRARELRSVTDGEGKASMALTGAGRWSLRAIHMMRRDEDPEVQWESLWTTMTFEVAF